MHDRALPIGQRAIVPPRFDARQIDQLTQCGHRRGIPGPDHHVENQMSASEEARSDIFERSLERTNRRKVIDRVKIASHQLHRIWQVKARHVLTEEDDAGACEPARGDPQHRSGAINAIKPALTVRELGEEASGSAADVSCTRKSDFVQGAAATECVPDRLEPRIADQLIVERRD
jgi:hypothetical protein